MCYSPHKKRYLELKASSNYESLTCSAIATADSTTEHDMTHHPAMKPREGRKVPADSLLPHELWVQILSYNLVQQKQPVKLRSAAQRRWKSEIDALKQDLASMSTKRKRVQATTSTNTKKDRKRFASLSVLRVCKTFYFAGTEAFYGSNTLAFSSLKDFSAFARKIEIDRKSCIKRIVVDLGICNSDWKSYELGHAQVKFRSLEPVSEDLVEGLHKLESVTFRINPIYSHNQWVEEKVKELFMALWSHKADFVRFEET